MKELAGEFDELNELIYVADTETYELLYLNRRGLQVFGLKDPEPVSYTHLTPRSHLQLPQDTAWWHAAPGKDDSLPPHFHARGLPRPHG